MDSSAAIREAIIKVMQSLPDKRVDHDKVARFALSALAADDPCRLEAETLIRRLVKLSPKCHGVFRSRQYWRLIRQYMTSREDKERVLLCYLQKFPDSLTVRQYRAVENYLVGQFGLAETEAIERMRARFMLRSGSENFHGRCLIGGKGLKKVRVTIKPNGKIWCPAYEQHLRHPCQDGGCVQFRPRSLGYCLMIDKGKALENVLV